MISPTFSWWLAVVLISTTGAFVHYGSWTYTQTPTSYQVQLPDRIGSWMCDDAMKKEHRYTDPNVDAAWIAVCNRQTGYPLEVYVGYAAHQTLAKKILSPKMNYPDSQWSDVLNRPAKIEIDRQENPTRHINVNQTLLRNNVNQKVAVLYWYQMDGRSFSDEYQYRFALLIRKLTHEGTDAAVIRISAPVLENSPDRLFSEEVDLVRSLYGEVRRQFPQLF
jgi:EpsI family protein